MVWMRSASVQPIGVALTLLACGCSATPDESQPNMAHRVWDGPAYAPSLSGESMLWASEACNGRGFSLLSIGLRTDALKKLTEECEKLIPKALSWDGTRVLFFDQGTSKLRSLDPNANSEVELALSNGAPASIVADNTHVYFTDEAGLHQVDRALSDVPITLLDTAGLATHAGEYLYATSEGYLFRVEKASGEAIGMTIVDGDATTIAVDGGYVYWATTGLVSRTPVTPAQIDDLVAEVEVWDLPVTERITAIAPTEQGVFVAMRGESLTEYQIDRLEKGGATTTLHRGGAVAGAPELIATATDLYWNDASGLWSLLIPKRSEAP